MHALLLLLLSAAAAGETSPAIPRRLAEYDFDAARTFEQRIAPMPPSLLETWRVLDKAPGYASYTLNPAEKSEFLAALGALPPRLKQVLKDRLIAFYFISDLQGNGITDWVLDDSKRTHVYMVLNPAGFKKSLSQLLTGREGSVFQGEGALSVDAGEGGSGILYTVAHESAHVFDYVVGLTRFTDPHYAQAVGKTPGGWDLWTDYYQPGPATAFPARARLRFYGVKPPELAAAEAPAVCAQLKASPFASLYGATNWADDAAELFLFDHLTRTLGRPYRYTCGGKVYDLVTPARKARAARVLKPLYGK
jgi:hypothetical protein